MMRLILIVFWFVCIAQLTFAASENINTAENFPDPIFRAVVEQTLGVEPGGVITKEDAAAVTYLDCSFGKITDLSGIEHFTTLVELVCAVNRLTKLDISKNTVLERLYCFTNRLTELDVSQNTALVELDCYKNQIKELDVSKNTALVKLTCGANQLKELNVSNNTVLITFGCYDNQLTKLNVSNNTALVGFGCGIKIRGRKSSTS